MPRAAGFLCPLLLILAMGGSGTIAVLLFVRGNGTVRVVIEVDGYTR